MQPPNDRRFPSPGGMLPLTRNPGMLRGWIDIEIPEQNFAFHDSKFVTLDRAQRLSLEQMTQNNTGLLWVSTSQGLVEGFEQLIVWCWWSSIHESSLSGTKGTFCLGLMTSFSLLLLLFLSFLSYWSLRSTGWEKRYVLGLSSSASGIILHQWDDWSLILS